ncbi:hypothetical protein EDD15DRAFT_2203763 [Pisolithus albus]|nr:hypothetical protein EDD15DRAFT_2203763 [Pisolithus albus]
MAKPNKLQAAGPTKQHLHVSTPCLGVGNQKLEKNSEKFQKRKKTRCATLDHPLALYLQATLAVELYLALALILVAVAALTCLLISISKIHQAAVLSPTAAAPVPATTITTTRRRLPLSLHPRTYEPSRETNQNWKSSPSCTGVLEKVAQPQSHSPALEKVVLSRCRAALACWVSYAISLHVRITPGPVNAISRPPLTRPSRKPGFELYSTRAFGQCIFCCIQPSTSEDISQSLEKGIVGRNLGYLGIGIRPSGSPPTRCCPPILYPIRHITHAPLHRISRFSQTLIYQTTPTRRYTRRRECIPGSRVIRIFVFGQGGEVGFAYLGRFRTRPLAFSRGGTTCSQLPGYTLFMVTRALVVEIQEFIVRTGVQDSLVDISGTVVAELFEFSCLNQGREVKIAYLTHFCVEPLAFPYGGYTCLQLPGDTLFMGTRPWVPEIWEFMVYKGVQGDSADVSRLEAPIGALYCYPGFGIGVGKASSLLGYGLGMEWLRLVWFF